jgi:hypothetical protein
MQHLEQGFGGVLGDSGKPDPHFRQLSGWVGG